MKDRILKGWTVMRVLYAVTGLAVIIQSSVAHSWMGVAFGAYFGAMGVFGFGCAAGVCFDGSCDKPYSKKKGETTMVNFEEVIEKRHGNE